MHNEVLGVDIGGVIIDRANDSRDTSFFRNRYLESTAVEGAFEAIRRLNYERFKGKVILVSKCGPRTELRTQEWLLHHRFYDATGLSPDKVFYCRTREDKDPICEELKVTHFIDDKLEVLSYLRTVPHRYLFNPVETEVRRFAQHLSLVHRVTTWNEILASLLP